MEGTSTTITEEPTVKRRSHPCNCLDLAKALLGCLCLDFFFKLSSPEEPQKNVEDTSTPVDAVMTNDPPVSNDVTPTSADPPMSNDDTSTSVNPSMLPDDTSMPNDPSSMLLRRPQRPVIDPGRGGQIN